MTAARPRPLETIRLEAPALPEALGVGPDTRLAGAWGTEAAYPHHEGGLLLSFREQGGRRTVGLQVRPRDDARPAWRRTRHLDLITHLPPDEEPGPLLAALGELAARLEALDGEATRVVEPAPAGDPPPPVGTLDLAPPFRAEAPSPFAFGRVFVLDLASDCGHRCSFCSTRSKLSPQGRFGEGERARLLAGLDRALATGWRVLRLSGLDPLAHPHVVDVVAHATALGFEHVHVYSPGTRWADAALREALLDALPPGRFTLHVPLYGPTAEVHEAVTGVPGSFERVTAGLDALVARAGAERLLLLTVVTRENVAHLPALRAVMGRWPAPVQVFLPFPSTRDADDAFYRVAVSHEAMVGPMSACDPPLGTSELLPCVRFRHERDTGAPALSRGGFPPVTAHLGTLFQHATYRRLEDGPDGNTFTIPVRACPHAGACALAAVCPRAVYAAYAERFGLGELQPVSAAELRALGLPEGHPARPA